MASHWDSRNHSIHWTCCFYCHERERTILISDASDNRICARINVLLQNNVSYLCPNCQNVFNPKTLDFIKAQHTPKTRKLTCPDCHETHFCIEVPKMKNNVNTSPNVTLRWGFYRS